MILDLLMFGAIVVSSMRIGMELERRRCRRNTLVVDEWLSRVRRRR